MTASTRFFRIPPPRRPPCSGTAPDLTVFAGGTIPLPEMRRAGRDFPDQGARCRAPCRPRRPVEGRSATVTIGATMPASAARRLAADPLAGRSPCTSSTCESPGGRPPWRAPLAPPRPRANAATSARAIALGWTRQVRSTGAAGEWPEPSEDFLAASDRGGRAGARAIEYDVLPVVARPLTACVVVTPHSYPIVKRRCRVRTRADGSDLRVAVSRRARPRPSAARPSSCAATGQARSTHVDPVDGTPSPRWTYRRRVLRALVRQALEELEPR